MSAYDPQETCAALDRCTAIPSLENYLAGRQIAAAALGLEEITAPVHDEAEFEPIFASQASTPNTGLVLIKVSVGSRLKAKFCVKYHVGIELRGAGIGSGLEASTFSPKWGAFAHVRVGKATDGAAFRPQSESHTRSRRQH